MEVTGGRILVKSGAEGYQAIALAAEVFAPGTPALGIAFKIADGDLTGRAGRCVALDILRQLGAITPQELEKLDEFDDRPIYNQRNIQVGQVQSHFELYKDERYFGA
jgi:L-asparaginase II